MSEIYKIPFLRFLIPFLVGILLQYYFYISKWSIVIVTLGAITMLWSFFISNRKQFKYRWLFGFGFYLLLLSLGVFITWVKQYQNAFPFTEAHQVYSGYIANIPQNKPNTIAFEVVLDRYGRKIVCYLPKDSLSASLTVGDNISFIAKILPFQKVGQIGHFDYAGYMYNRGYCGYTFVNEDLWQKEKNSTNTLITLAAQTRKQILEFYKKLKLDNDEFALLAGLTIGYTTDLSDSLVQDFRGLGVAHILSVSGLHVGIVYLVIMSLLQFNVSRKKKQILIILLLWIYIFIVGLPPSAIRAGIMFTLFCIAIICNKKIYTYNSIFAAAFLILVWNPLLFFDVGFQLSFVSVLSIKLFMPPLVSFFKFKNKIAQGIWNLLTLSFAAQVGLLPLSLYYFGTFPIYFLFANLLIVPIVSIIIYLVLVISVIFYLKVVLGSIFSGILDFMVFCCRFLLKYIIEATHLLAQIPYSAIRDIEISLLTMFLLYAALILIYSLYKKLRSVTLNLLLICCLLIVVVAFYERYTDIDTFTIYKNPQKIRIAYQRNFAKKTIIDAHENKVFNLNGQKLLLLVNDNYRSKRGVADRQKIDYLYIESDKSTSIVEISTLFDVKNVILGNCLSSKTIKRLKLECEKKRIPYYDIYTKGNLTINF